jgi:type I restriction enzyme S subunit
MEEGVTPALVPKLRFPEFLEAGAWEQKFIEDFFNVGSSKRILQKDWVAQGIPFYRTRELVSLSKNEPFSSEIFISKSLFEEITQKYGTPKEGDFLVSGVGTLGISFLVKKSDEFYFKDGNVLWLSRKGGVSSLFFKYCFESDVIQDQILKQASVSTVGTYTIQNAKITKFYCPPTEKEQQKIAECLSSVDDLIAAQARKVDALKAHKKGLMQQLFPREGETQPRLRFPEFHDAGSWETKTLGSIASFSSGGTPSKDNPKYWNGSIPWISASSMYELIIEKAGHYVTPLAIGNGTRIAKKGSILILVRGSMLFKRVPICVAAIDVAFNQDVRALDVDPSINTSFLLYQLSAFQSRIPINETGIGAGKIELEHLKGFDLFMPEDPAEQQHIADCLTNLDDLIAAQIQKLEAVKIYKKGLMQQLFPSPETVEA